MERVDRLVKIENVVASATLKHGIDLRDVARAFPKMKYHPDQFPGLVFRLKKPRTTILIFGSGKMVCTGAKSASEARRALRRVIRKLKDAGIVILGRLSTKIQNIVASANLGGKVDLVGWYESQSLGGRMMYEPEQFPGLIYRMKEPRGSDSSILKWKAGLYGRKEGGACVSGRRPASSTAGERRVHILLRTTKARALKDVLCLEKIFIKHAENIKNARARCTVFDSDHDEEPQ